MSTFTGQLFAHCGHRLSGVAIYRAGAFDVRTADTVRQQLRAWRRPPTGWRRRVKPHRRRWKTLGRKRTVLWKRPDRGRTSQNN